MPLLRSKRTPGTRLVTHLRPYPPVTIQVGEIKALAAQEPQQSAP
jgi:hypothetical protein